jgi:hypothetical protein
MAVGPALRVYYCRVKISHHQPLGVGGGGAGKKKTSEVLGAQNKSGEGNKGHKYDKGKETENVNRKFYWGSLRNFAVFSGHGRHLLFTHADSMFSRKLKQVY